MGVYRGELSFYGAVSTLLRPQREFLSATEPNAAFCGGVGSGKTIALCLSALMNGARDPDGLSLIGRRNIPALQDSTQRSFLELCPASWGTWKPSESRFTMQNGHQFIFRHLDISDPHTSGHIKSMNLSAAYVDEATEVSEEIYFLLLTRIRRKGDGPRVVRLASNPAGHDWLWRNFFDPSRSEKLKQINRGITATTFDNVHLSEAYTENMLATYPEDWVERYLYASFADFSEMIYKEFSIATHLWDAEKKHSVFNDDSNPPLSWPVICGIDIGSDSSHDPWGVCLIAVAPDGTLYQFAEVYGRGLLVAEIAAEIKMKNEGRPDPQIAFDYSNRQCGLELANEGLPGQAAIKEVRPGIFQMAQYLHIDQRIENPFTGEKGSPRLFISSACTNTIREISGYKYAKLRSGQTSEDPAHDNSHLPDSIRYAIRTFRPLPEKMIIPARWEAAHLNPVSREFWKKEDASENLRYPERAGMQMTMAEWRALAEKAQKAGRFVRPNRMKFYRTGV